MTRQKILVIEDETDILDMLEYALSREGFRVLGAHDGEHGVRLARREAPHLILLDLMLPGRDGIEVCRVLKGDPITRDVPVIMVTAKGEESDIVLGLGVGADDYVTKPFNTRELLARVRAVMRRRRVDDTGPDQRVVVDGLVVDPSRLEVLVDGTAVTFTPTELRLLHLLASNAGRAFTREQLISRVIGGGAHVVNRNVDVHVRAVRGKIGRYRGLIETIRGVGYRFKDR